MALLAMAVFEVAADGADHGDAPRTARAQARPRSSREPSPLNRAHPTRWSKRGPDIPRAPIFGRDPYLLGLMLLGRLISGGHPGPCRWTWVDRLVGARRRQSPSGLRGRGLIVTIASGPLLSRGSCGWPAWIPAAGGDTRALRDRRGRGSPLGACPRAARALSFHRHRDGGVRWCCRGRCSSLVHIAWLLAARCSSTRQCALGMAGVRARLCGGLLAASDARQAGVRAEQAELLLAQTQRSHEEQLRAARLEESRGSRGTYTTCSLTPWLG